MPRALTTAVAAAPPLPPGRALDLPGRGTTFVRELQGPRPGAPTVLLLHGLSANADLNWFPSFGTLARHFRVVALDHRGHGRGIRSRRRFRLEDCADDAAAVAEQLGIDRLTAVGYSMGGPIAQLLWRRHRRLVDGLVLCATSRNFRGHPRERLMFSVLPGMTAAVRLTPGTLRRRIADELFGRKVIDSPIGQWAFEELRRNSPTKVLEAAQSLGRFTSADWIGEVDVPTAVVVTTRDQLVPPSRQLKLARAIPAAVVHPVEGDHTVCVSSPKRFVPVLVDACLQVAR